jgi:hypothetical protein
MQSLRIRIRNPVPFGPWIRDTVSGIGFFRIPNPNPYFYSLNTKIFSVYMFKNKIIYNFMIFVVKKNSRTKNISGSGIDKNQDPGYPSRICNTDNMCE